MKFFFVAFGEIASILTIHSFLLIVEKNYITEYELSKNNTF